MSRDAAKRFRELVEEGDEIPYDVRDSSDGSSLPQYVPLTERFVREHTPILRELDSFGAACAAIESAGLAAPYLEESGVEVPGDPRRRGELAGVVFLARMWMDSTDFSLDDERLRAAVAELEANADAGEGEIEIVVPLRGLRMEAVRLDLATASIVRADSVDVPAEARAPEASGGAGWEPTFLVVARVSGEAGEPAEDGAVPVDAGPRAVGAFKELITSLRLFKSGGVGLGPHAWTRAGGGRWRRISTGAGRPRPGGYRLAASELAELQAFSRATSARSAERLSPGRPRPATALERAIGRFEAGLERTAALDALNDYLLSLRFLLEGGGPAALGLPMRVASLCAEPDERSAVKAVIDRAVALERELWSGEPPLSGRDGPTPAETALAVEELARAILKDGASGYLGNDLRATADEILLADGLAAGDGAGAQRGGTAEWATADDDPEAQQDLALELEEELESEIAPEHKPEPEPEPEHAPEDQQSDPDGPRYGRDAPVVPVARAEPAPWDDSPEPSEGDEAVQVIGVPQRIRIDRTDRTDHEEETTTMLSAAHHEHPEHEPEAGEGPVGKLLALHSVERRATADRVANLFPRPETTEWNVREISYDRTRRAPAGDRAS